MQNITYSKFEQLKRHGYASVSESDHQVFILQRNPETQGTELVPVTVEGNARLRGCCETAAMFGQVCRDCAKRNKVKAPRVKNNMAKTRPVDRPYETWQSRDGSWTWKVLKKYQVDDSKPYARWLCAVSSPFTYGGYEMGDCYVKDIVDHARLIQSAY
jgi:hypothetical protein